MTRWAQSLIKLSNYEVETLQKRLSEIADQRSQVEMKLAMLHAEGEAEQAAAALDPQNGWRIVHYMQALGVRMDAVRRELHLVQLEEQGVRDSLGKAFETQKKYEQVAEQAQILAVKQAGQREAAQMDELGLRRAAGGR
ncbi:MAG TPA: flagellar export protein FliJ [Phenylobacterium sp.]|uniref:flagellar export protein FliJ n=1 Tax=Phenylobacterium sp. TaxID=1871053 RepID=UPI002B496D7E|nr:flagellar export protein FliJ [Phenylobacterium sp.]HKR90360.1 flagellar export protein FliJ [Phenylobacterium sp.]